MHEELCRIWRDFRDDDAVDVAVADRIPGVPTCGPGFRRTTSMQLRAESARSSRWGLEA
jgi:hypothetical protein